MLISVIVPTRNRAAFLATALDSILGQSHRPLEVIVVDGASTDGTDQVLRDYAARWPELRWISEPDDGPAGAVNKGLAMARGDWIGIQSSDDLYCPEALADVAQFIRDNPGCGFLYGDVRGLGEDERPLAATRHPEFSWEAMFGIALCLPQGSIFFRGDVARETAGWNSKYFGCDLDYWLRLMMRTRAAKVPKVLSLWRVHGGQRTRQEHFPSILEGYRRMIADSEDLARASPRLRRLAAASCSIMALNFDASAGPWRRRRYALAALLRHPTFWRYQPRARLVGLLPGYRTAMVLREFWRAGAGRRAAPPGAPR